MNDSGRKVNIRPAENEFSELMRLLLAWTDNDVNHSEQDLVGYRSENNFAQTGRPVLDDCPAFPS